MDGQAAGLARAGDGADVTLSGVDTSAVAAGSVSARPPGCTLYIADPSIPRLGQSAALGFPVGFGSSTGRGSRWDRVSDPCSHGCR